MPENEQIFVIYHKSDEHTSDARRLERRAHRPCSGVQHCTINNMSSRASKPHSCSILPLVITAHLSPPRTHQEQASCSTATFALRAHTLAGSPPSRVRQATAHTALCLSWPDMLIAALCSRVRCFLHERTVGGAEHGETRTSRKNIINTVCGDIDDCVWSLFQHRLVLLLFV